MAATRACIASVRSAVCSSAASRLLKSSPVPLTADAHAGARIGGAVAGVEHPVTGAQRVQLSEDALLDERKQSLLFAQFIELRLEAPQFLAGHASQLASEARQALGPG